MKKVEAIIRKTVYNEVKDSLHAVGIDFFTFWEARGVGQSVQERVYRGIVYDTSTIERIYITFFCNDEFLIPAVEALVKSAKTGEYGDGRVFVSTIDEAYRIRTGETGSVAIGTKV